jgi:2-methylcitrate dehydratase
MDETAERLVGIATADLGDLPKETSHAVSRTLIDSLGCALGGLDQPEAKAVGSYAGHTRGEPGASVIGAGPTTSPEVAALVNGVLIRCLDFNDDYFGGVGDLGPHPSDTLGALIAAVESAGGSGQDLVSALVVAYEVIGQLVDRLAPGGSRSWDYTFLHAAGTALGAGRALGLSAPALRHALGIAITSGIGLYESRTGELSNWKAFAGPHASRNGLQAALLAQAGITGPAEPFSGRAGLCRLIGQPIDLGDLPLGTGGFKIEGAYFKSLPVRYTNQLPVEIGQRVGRELGTDDIERVVVLGISRDRVDRKQRPELWQPDSRETADHSVPYLVAAALADGEISAETFTRRRYTDPQLLALAARIEVTADEAYDREFPRTQLGRLEVTLRSGELRVFEQANPHGHPANPMDDDALVAKFRRHGAGRLPEDRLDEVLERLWGIADEPSLLPLMALLRSASSSG